VRRLLALLAVPIALLGGPPAQAAFEPGVAVTYSAGGAGRTGVVIVQAGAKDLYLVSRDGSESTQYVLPGSRLTLRDRDADGVPDNQDSCPTQPGAPPSGCPPPADRDGDGVPDADDQCPDESGNEPNGCPPAPPPARPAITFGRVNQGNGGAGFAASAARSEYIVLQGFWRRAEIAEINATNPNAKILIYANATRTAAPDTVGNYSTCVTRAEAQARGWNSGVRDWGESWMNLVDPSYSDGSSTATDYANFCLARLKERLAQSALAGYPVDGVFLDDTNSYSSGVQGGLPDADGNGTVDPNNRGVDAAYWNAWMQQVNSILGPGLRAGGYVAVPNLSASLGERNLESGGWEERQFDFFDGIFTEFSTLWPGGTPISQPYVNEFFRLTQVAQAKRVVMISGEPQDTSTEARQAFGLGICLVQTEGYCSKSTGAGNADAWYPVYDRAEALGQPTASATSPSSGAWTRQFQHGSVRIDLNARTATISP
jgi:hypothetical protein